MLPVSAAILPWNSSFAFSGQAGLLLSGATMLPYILLPFIDLEVRTSSLLMAGSFFFMIWLIFSLPLPLSRIHRLFLVSGGFLFSLYGARVFHALVESPGFFWEHPAAMFINFNGMTFYGSFIAGSSFLALWGTAWSWSRYVRDRVWDQASIGASVIYGVMRIGCFFNGCCWGKISGLPWAVRYYSMRGAMPSLGIPVHPVQLYEALLGFSIALVLLLERKSGSVSGLFGRPGSAGSLFGIFCLLYGPGRFVLEFFRGDNYRGTDVILGLSVSQTISIPVSLFGCYLMMKRREPSGSSLQKKELRT